jgi:hypothetical protein
VTKDLANPCGANNDAPKHLMHIPLRTDFPTCSADGMLCPVCGFHCTHLTACTVNQLGEVTTIRGTGTTMHVLPASPARGSRIDIEAYCEEGHRFTITLRFHKGSVYVTTTRLQDCPLELSGEGYSPPVELRRD